MAIASFFIAHWVLSIFCQTFFLHRYSAHRMFRMSKGWERFFHFLTWFAQGASYLQPRAYAILHRMHHAYSDTPKDPHSPRFFATPFSMMWHTKDIYLGLLGRKVEPESRFENGYPSWKLLDETLNNMFVATAFMAAYTLYYVQFATSPWQYLLLPIHFLVGPVQGAIVNWGGHKYGYRNFFNKDDSKNTLVFDLVTWGELFQNNHHTFGMAPNFAVRWFEIDPCYQVMKVLQFARIIDMTGAQQTHWAPGDEAAPDGLPAE